MKRRTRTQILTFIAEELALTSGIDLRGQNGERRRFYMARAEAIITVIEAAMTSYRWQSEDRKNVLARIAATKRRKAQRTGAAAPAEKPRLSFVENGR